MIIYQTSCSLALIYKKWINKSIKRLVQVWCWTWLVQGWNVVACCIYITQTNGCNSWQTNAPNQIITSQNFAILFSLWLRFGTENGSDGLVKDILQSLLCQCRTLQVFDGIDFSGHGQALGVGDGTEFFVSQLLDGFSVFPEIQLGSHKYDGSVGTVVTHFWIPLKQNNRNRLTRK